MKTLIEIISSSSIPATLIDIPTWILVLLSVLAAPTALAILAIVAVLIYAAIDSAKTEAYVRRKNRAYKRKPTTHEPRLTTHENKEQ